MLYRALDFCLALRDLVPVSKRLGLRVQGPFRVCGFGFDTCWSYRVKNGIRFQTKESGPATGA